FVGGWLALDPVVKCTYVIVQQQMRSRREGNDLRGLLASLPRQQRDKAELAGSMTSGSRAGSRAGLRATFSTLALLALILSGAFQLASPRTAQALPVRPYAQAPSGVNEPARVQTLRGALDEESKRAIYRWHDAAHQEAQTWFDKWLEKLGRA